MGTLTGSKQSLSDKISAGKLRSAIIGLGYVGLPLAADPFAPEINLHGKIFPSADSGAAGEVFQSVPARTDLAVLTTDHKTFDYEFILKHVPVFLDARNATKNLAAFRKKIHKL